MVTLTFDLDYDKMERDGVTEAEMLEPMREHSRKYGIRETSRGVFSMDGEDALCVMMMYVMRVYHNSQQYVRYLRTWVLTTTVTREDCKQEIIKHYKKEGIAYIE